MAPPLVALKEGLQLLATVPGIDKVEYTAEDYQNDDSGHSYTNAYEQPA